MSTSAYMDGRVQYRRPQAILLADNPGTLVNNILGSGLSATISEGTNIILVLGGDDSLINVGQSITVSSGKGIVGVGAKIESIDETSYGKLITTNVPHMASGDIIFDTGTYGFVPDGDEFTNFVILSDHNRGSLDFTPERIEKRERMINGRMRSYHVADKMKLSVSWSNIPSRAFQTLPTFDENGKPNIEPFTVDAGAGGNDLLKWYEEHVGSFWVYVAYDKYTTYKDDQTKAVTTQSYGHMAQYNQVLEMYISDFSHKVLKRGTLYDMWDVSMTLEEA